VRRNGHWEKDNGYCRGARLIVYFAGRSPDKSADCKPNEVQVPLVVGMTADDAAARLADQPLGAAYVYKPAQAGRPTGVVVDQIPRHGGLSAHDDVTLVVSKSVDGLVPNFVGSTLKDARPELKRLGLHVKRTTGAGSRGVILRQSPRPGVAAAKGLLVTLVVGDGSRTATR
jgi:beta-lactam-binding protein with PASTA domain